MPGAVDAAEAFLSEASEPEIREHVARVASVIDGFESPYGMELLATVDWVAIHEPEVRTVDEATAAVESWNERKRRGSSVSTSRLPGTGCGSRAGSAPDNETPQCLKVCVALAMFSRGLLSTQTQQRSTDYKNGLDVVKSALRIPEERV